MLLGHLYKDDGIKRWPSDKAKQIVVKMSACKLLYIKGFLKYNSNFFALLDIEDFWLLS